MSAPAISGARNPSIPSSSSPISDMAKDAWLELPSGEEIGNGRRKRWLAVVLAEVVEAGVEVGVENGTEADVETDAVEGAVKLAR